MFAPGKTRSLLLLVAAAFLQAAQAESKEPIRREVKTPMGQEVRANQHAGYDVNCQPRPVKFTLLRPPVDGTVEARSESIVAGKSAVGSFSCEGRTVSGIAVYFTPRAGFQGTESFSYEVRYEAGTLTYEAVVRVN